MAGRLLELAAEGVQRALQADVERPPCGLKVGKRSRMLQLSEVGHLAVR